MKPDSGYYSTTAIAQHAIDMLAEHQANHADQPFLLYLAFTSPHFPLHALPEDIALYRDRYRRGLGCAAAGTLRQDDEDGAGQLPAFAPGPGGRAELEPVRGRTARAIGPGEAAHAVPWQELTDEQRQFQPIKMALHAAMVHRMDIEIGRVLAQLKAMDALDNTAIFFLSDNGASAEQIIRGDMHDRTAPPGSAKTFLSHRPRVVQRGQHPVPAAQVLGA